MPSIKLIVPSAILLFVSCVATARLLFCIFKIPRKPWADRLSKYVEKIPIRQSRVGYALLGLVLGCPLLVGVALWSWGRQRWLLVWSVLYAISLDVSNLVAINAFADHLVCVSDQA